MEYENAKDIFPEHFLKQIQEYVSGKLVYIPAKEVKRRWGETSGYRQHLIERNRCIRSKFSIGVSIEQLAEEFCLSLDSIKKIVYSRKESLDFGSTAQGSTNIPFNRKIYVSNEQFCLGEYITEIDSAQHYECWQDADTQDGYNYRADFTFEEFVTAPERLRLESVVIRNSDSAVIGVVTLSPEDYLPDLAIMLYPRYRSLGYSTPVFQMALDYCFETFSLNEIYAGCYEDNIKSLKMITNCGFEPHPASDSSEVHFMKGTPRIQKDFVKYR